MPRLPGRRVGGVLSFVGLKGSNHMGVYEATPVSTELQTREWFVAHIGEFGYDIVVSQDPFPDYVLRDGEGQLLRCEAEYESKNFLAHKHDPKVCDLVVCWVHTQNLALPVLELSTGIVHDMGQGAISEYIRPSRPDRAEREPADLMDLARDALKECRSELDAFMEAFTTDLQIHSDFIDAIKWKRLDLLAASRRLEDAWRVHGGSRLLSKQEGRWHPYDLFRLLETLKIED